MIIESHSRQELQFVARLDVSPRTDRGASGNEAKHEIPFDFARATAPKAWEEMDEAKRGPRPIVAIDVGERAKAAGVKPDDVLAALKRDAGFANLLARGVLTLR